jgi:hypothetical protein
MTPEEAISILIQKFNSVDYIDLTTSTSTTISGNPTLVKFFLGDNSQSLSDIVANGVRYLRAGVYKIIDEPIYRTDITPGTFNATVLYLGGEDESLIKFKANIGPMSNSKSRYAFDYNLNAHPQHLLQKEYINRCYADRADFSYQPKKWYFSKIYTEGKLFMITDQRLLPPETPGGKCYRQITFMFLT